MARRILIICHDFPPLNTSASRRPYSWARTWTDLGHEVHVLTTAKYAHDQLTRTDLDMTGFSVHSIRYLWKVVPDESNGTQADGSARATGRALNAWLFAGVKKLTRRLRLGLGMYAEKTTMAYRPMVRVGRRLLAAQRFDLIVSTSGPDMCPMVAARLAVLFGVAWASDYRDLWFDEFAVNRYAVTTWAVNRLHSRLIRRANLVSTVSSGLAEYLERIAPGRVGVFYNGYLESTVTPVVPEVSAQPAGVLRVVYTGTFYPLKRDPEMFLEAVRALLVTSGEGRTRLRVDFYGPTEAWVHDQLVRRGLTETVVLHGIVSHQESIRAQSDASILLFIDWMDARAEGVLTGKLFEYLASGKPILCVGNRDTTEAARLIQFCRAGHVGTSVNQVRNLLSMALSGDFRTAPDLARIGLYTRRAQAESLLLRAQEVMSPQV